MPRTKLKKVTNKRNRNSTVSENRNNAIDDVNNGNFLVYFHKFYAFCMQLIIIQINFDSFTF